MVTQLGEDSFFLLKDALITALAGHLNDKGRSSLRRRRGDLLNLKKGSCMERKNYRIIALDMDGTLLTSDKTIVPDTKCHIRAAKKRARHSCGVLHGPHAAGAEAVF